MVDGGQVFVSHTSDMAAYPPTRSFVQAAVDAVLKGGLRPVDMAQFAARGDPPADYCRSQVRACDIYVAVVGFRYGTPVPGQADGVSYTELEFRTATEVGIPRLVFVLADDVPVPRSLVDKDSRAIDAFRDRLHHADVIVKAVATPVELGEAVLHSLYEQRLHQAAHGRHRSRYDSDQDGRPTADRMVGSRRPWMAPPLDRVVERPELGGRLVAALTGPGPAEVGLTTALQGAGGFGKTTLAAWACHQMEIDRRYPGGLLWVTIGQEIHSVDLAEKVNDLAFALSGQRPLISDPDAAGAELGRLLDERPPVLLVVDDVWEPAQLRPFRFGGNACTRLISTRIPDLLPADGSNILVDVMSLGQARDLLVQGIGGLSADAVDGLATTAGRWPVLLSLVNGALRRRVAHGQLVEDAAEEIHQLLTTHGPTVLDPGRPGDRTRAVAATVEASLRLLDSADRDCYLDLAIFPEDVDIPLDVLALLWPASRVAAACEEFTGLGLAADYRLDPPGPRLVLHDVLRAYLRNRRGPDGRALVHRRLIAAAARMLPTHDDGEPVPWWHLPANAGYLWRFLPHHLYEAGMSGELAAMVCDLRWVEAKARQASSVIGAVSDIELVGTPTAAALAQTLRHAAPLLVPIDPPDALGATLASRIHAVPGLDAVLASYQAALPRPRLEPAWPLPDRHDPSASSAFGHTGSVTSCSFSPDGVLVATTGDDRTARLWRVTDGDQIAVLTHTGGVWDCAFSPDGALLATVCDDHTVRLWQLADGTEQAVLIGHTDWVTGCAFSSDGVLLATTGQDRTVRLWQVTDGAQRAVLTGHTDGLWGCAFSPDGALLASTGKDRTVRLWDVCNGAQLAVLTGHADGTNRCAFSPDATLLAATGDDGTTRLWRVADGEEVRALVGHAGRTSGCAFSPDGTLLATTGIDETARLWRVSDGAPQAVLTGHSSWVRGCAFSPDGAVLATASTDGTACLWRLTDGTAQTRLANDAGIIRRCTFSPDGTLLATVGTNGKAQLRHVSGGAAQTLVAENAGMMWGCTFSPDGTILATASDDGSARLWHVPGGTVQKVLVCHNSALRTCVFSPDGMYLATANRDRTARLWDVSSGAQVAALTGHSQPLMGCAFSPDGTLLATTGDDRTVRLWRIPNGTELAVLTGHSDVVNGCTFSPDGSLLATTSDDRTTRLWRIPDGTRLPAAVLSGHTGWVEDCAFTPDGTLVATASRDGTVRLWQVTTGHCLCSLRVAGPLFGITWHPDGITLSVVGGKGVYMLSYLP